MTKLNKEHLITTIRFLIENDEDGGGPFDAYGLRVIPGSHKKPEIGDMLDPSYRWEDNNWTDNKFNGTCAIELPDIGGTINDADIKKAFINLSDYSGNYIVMISGEGMGVGQDEDEIIIENAKVLNVWERKEFKC